MNMETFSTETSSRRVLKELLGEFSTTANDLTTKFATNQDQTKNVKQKVENLDVIVKGMKENIKFVKEFEKRVTKLENTT
jgi:polyhydroxyalkanoate synthesis regulator phasin